MGMRSKSAIVPKRKEEVQRKNMCQGGNLAPTCLTSTFPIHWTKTWSGQPEPGKMLRGEYPGSVSPVALRLCAALKGELCPLSCSTSSMLPLVTSPPLVLDQRQRMFVTQM
jgi:hypothetical protein